MNVVCLVIDRLHVGYLGCYGNAWIGTYHFDRLAAESLVLDQALVESPDLAAQYGSFGSGLHLLERSSGTQAADNLLAALTAGAIRSTLITDEPDLKQLRWAAHCDEVIRVPQEAVSVAAESIEQTQLARFFAVLGDQLAAAEEPFCLWAHSRGMGGARDAPYALRELFAEADEPAPTTFTDVPSRTLPRDYDPDELLGVTQAYAGQVALLDSCLGGLLEALDAHPAGRCTLLCVLSPRGFPLGEHRHIGSSGTAAYAELIQTPWLMRFPGELGRGERSQSLVQACDLAPTLREWLGLPAALTGSMSCSLLALARGEVETLRDRAIVVGPGLDRAIRTPAWYLRRGHAPSDPGDASRAADPSSQATPATPPTVELYAKPDDRWELNDVADRCPQVVELLEALLAESVTQNTDAANAPLPAVLLSGLD